MANRQVRNPGELARFEATGRVSEDIPSFAVDTGQAARALADAAGGLAETLGKLADRAAAREGQLAGLTAGQRSGAAYLQAQQSTAEATNSPAGPGIEIRAPGELRKIVSDAAQKYGVDPNALQKIAMLESSFNPKAKNPNSSAGGLFGFIDSTANQYGLVDRYDPAQAADAAARLARDNAAHLQRVLGRAPTAGELYLAHQQGAGGAAKLLTNPDAAASDLVGAEAVRLNGGQPGMTAGQFANLWTSRAGGGASVVDGVVTGSTHTAPLSTEPLALRRDGTIRGEAFDDAALSAWSWRMQEGLSNELFAAQQQFQDDPAGFAGAAQQIRDKYAQDLPADPAAREMFDKSFADRSQAYGRNIAANHEAKLRRDQVSSFTAGLSSRQLDLERQAQVLGATPDGDKIIGDQVRTVQASIDGAVSAGIITPAQGEQQKLEVATTAARGRIQGVYDALPTPEAKEQFSIAILEDWKEQKGPLSALPYATVKSISDTLRRDAREQINAKAADNKAEAARLSSLIDDDVASMATTGKGVDPNATGLTADRVKTIVGEPGLIKWQNAREHAGKIYDATSGMETQSAGDIAERLTMIEPKAGAPGYADDLEVYEAAQKQASAVLKARSQDPAAAMQKSFPSVQQVADQANPQDPASMQALVGARLQAQKGLDVSEFEQQPLTNAEALALARPISAQTDPRLASKAMTDLVDQVEKTYGPHANRVLSQVLAAQGIDKEMATLGAGYFARLKKGEKPTPSDRRQAGILDETAAATKSGEPRAAVLTGAGGDPTRPVPSAARSATNADVFPVPNYQQMQRLVDHPELAPAFDEKFGPGASQRIIGRTGPISYQTPQGIVTVQPDGTQTVQPVDQPRR